MPETPPTDTPCQCVDPENCPSPARAPAGVRCRKGPTDTPQRARELHVKLTELVSAWLIDEEKVEAIILSALSAVEQPLLEEIERLRRESERMAISISVMLGRESECQGLTEDRDRLRAALPMGSGGHYCKRYTCECGEGEVVSKSVQKRVTTQTRALIQDELYSRLKEYRIKWTPQKGFVYDPEGPFLEWRHIERLLR